MASSTSTLEQMVAEATDPALVETNYSLNLAVCDTVQSDPAYATPIIVAALKEHLVVPQRKRHVLCLLDMCLQNAPNSFALAVKNQNLLALVQQPAAMDGVTPVDEQVVQRIEGAVDRAIDYDDSDPHLSKLVGELQSVQQELQVPVHELATEDARVRRQEFLEQCSPRLVRLIEQGTSGVFQESILSLCLQLNDEVCKQIARDSNTAGGVVTSSGVATSDQTGTSTILTTSDQTNATSTSCSQDTQAADDIIVTAIESSLTLDSPTSDGTIVADATNVSMGNHTRAVAQDQFGSTSSGQVTAPTPAGGSSGAVASTVDVLNLTPKNGQTAEPVSYAIKPPPTQDQTAGFAGQAAVVTGTVDNTPPEAETDLMDFFAPVTVTTPPAAPQTDAKPQQAPSPFDHE